MARQISSLFVVAFVVVALASSCSSGEDEAGLPAGTIVTVVGSGEFGSGGVGGPAKEAQLQTPVDVAFGPDGNLYIAERFGTRILEVDDAGLLTVAAGSDQPGFSGDGGPATRATLKGASAIAVDDEGKLYIADSFNDRIRMVDRDGLITTIAGTGEPGFSGDGGRATKAQLAGPAGMAFDEGGNLWLVDLSNIRIRKIDPQGRITTVAGTGDSGFSPDGTPAAKAVLGGASDHVPAGLAVDAASNVLLTDIGNHRIRMIDTTGRIKTVTGNDTYTTSGDGGPAAKAGLDGPLDVVVDEKVVYFTTHDHGQGVGQRVRRIDHDGTITTVAGTGVTGYAGDGGPATKALLNIPAGLALGPDGNLYVADANNNVIRMIVL